MSRKVSLRWHWSVGLLVLELILSAGCEDIRLRASTELSRMSSVEAQFFGGADAHQIKIAPEKLRRIETLDLEQIKSGETKDTDPNKTPPEKLELSLEQCRASGACHVCRYESYSP